MKRKILFVLALGILSALWQFLTRDNHPTHPGTLEENGTNGQRAGLEMVWPGSEA